MTQKILLKKNGKKVFVKDSSKDMHTKDGVITTKQLNDKPGTTVETNKGIKMTVLDADFLDKLSKIKRGAQVIPFKDIGSIIMETGIGKESIVLDSGAGSGMMAISLANVAKKVISYEIREDHYNIVKKNIETLNIKNLKLKLGNVYEKIDEKDFDVINLDLPEPWEAIDNADKALKTGGYIISYSPTIPQVMDFTEKIKQNGNFAIIKTIEIIEREWDIIGRKVRPKTQQIGHSGFLTIVRKVS